MNITLDSDKITIPSNYKCLNEYIKANKLENDIAGIANLEGFNLFIEDNLPFYFENEYVVFDMTLANLPFVEYDDYHVKEVSLYTEGGFGGGLSPDYALMLYRAIDDFFGKYPLLSNVSFMIVTDVVKYLVKKNLVPYLKEFMRSLNERNKKLDSNLFKDTIVLSKDKKNDLNTGFDIITDMYHKGYLDDLYKYEDAEEDNEFDDEAKG